jgi:hypothetical protein
MATRPDGMQPYLSAPDGGALSIAVLWDRWNNPKTGEFVTSCRIIATAANTLTQAIHDRMPVILGKIDLGPGSAGTEPGSPRRSPSHVAASMRVSRTAQGMTIRRSSAAVPCDARWQIRGTESTLESCPSASGRWRCRAPCGGRTERVPVCH